MKQKILFIYTLVFFTCISFKEVNAQDFDLEFFQYFNANVANYPGATDAKSAMTKWRGSATNLSIGPKVTINDISARVIQNNRINSISLNVELGTNTTTNYLRAQLGHNDCTLVLESPNALRKVAFQYSGGNLQITTYPSARPDTIGLGSNGVVLMDSWKSTGLLKVLTLHDSTIPGVAEFIDVNDNPNGDTKYIEIQRNGSTSTKLWRMTASTTDFTTLPLNLLSFTAKSDAFGKAVNLNWKTTNEVNTKEFSIERRIDNSDFVSIGTIPSKNTDGIHNYAFTDNNAVEGNSYYRIKQIDNDGKFEYSDIQSVRIEGGVSLSLYPNPTTDELNISHALASNASIKVLSIQGNTVLEQKLAQGSTLSNVGVSQLAPGTYVLLLNNSGKQSTIKFIKK